jgi:parallel beta-helix repeat protein
MMLLREKLAWALAAALGIAVIATFAGVVRAGPLDPPRPPGSTQANLIYQPADCGGFPISITQSGSYALAENITIPNGCAKDGIDINVDNVTLDMRGFALQGATGAHTGIATGTFAALTLTDGKVMYWPGGGIDAAVHNSLLSRLEVMYNGATADGGQLRLGFTSRLSDCVVNNGAGTALGIVITGSINVVENCTVSGNNAQGLKVVGAANRISGNHLVGNDTSLFGCADLWVVGTSNVVEGNTAVFNGGDTCPFYIDASADGTVMYGNVAHSAGNGTNYTILNGLSDIAPLNTASFANTSWTNISD